MTIPRTRRALSLTLALLVAVAGAGAAAAAEPIRIKWSHALPVGGTMGVGAAEFAREVNARMADRVTVEVYPAAQLYKSLDGITALRRGDIQMVHEGNAYLASLVPEAQALELPFLFETSEQAFAAIDGPLGQEVFKRLEPKGIRVVANFALAFYDVANSRRPVRTVADLKGLKIRALGRVAETTFKALGASTISISASEIYTALSSGLIDGVFISPVSIVDRKLYEVQKYLTIANAQFTWLPVMVNVKFWDGLPPAIRGDLEKILREVEQKQRKQAVDDMETYVARLRASGMEVYTLPKAERESWKKATAEVYDSLAAQIGPDLVRRAREHR